MAKKAKKKFTKVPACEEVRVSELIRLAEKGSEEDRKWAELIAENNLPGQKVNVSAKVLAGLRSPSTAAKGSKTTA